MLSKNKAKFIKSLQLKKRREEHGCFAVEGKKSVLELLRSDFPVRTIVCTETFWEENKVLCAGKPAERILCSPAELERLSSFKTNNSALAVAELRPDAGLEKPRGLVLALDGVSDPGNLGTILRTADWFGVKTVVASKHTADVYNPKALQASMGSFCRVSLHYADLEEVFRGLRLPVYAASMEGESAHTFAFERDCIVLFGSEAHGISAPLLKQVRKTIRIPARGQAESLNVAASAAIICDNYIRMAR